MEKRWCGKCSEIGAPSRCGACRNVTVNAKRRIGLLTNVARGIEVHEELSRIETLINTAIIEQNEGDLTTIRVDAMIKPGFTWLVRKAMIKHRRFFKRWRKSFTAPLSLSQLSHLSYFRLSLFSLRKYRGSFPIPPLCLFPKLPPGI